MNFQVIISIGAALLSFYSMLIESFLLNGELPSFFSNAKEFATIVSETASECLSTRGASAFFGWLWIPIYMSIYASFKTLIRKDLFSEESEPISGVLQKLILSAIAINFVGNGKTLIESELFSGLRFEWIEALPVWGFVFGIIFLGIRSRKQSIGFFFVLVSLSGIFFGYYFFPSVHAALFPIAVGFALLGGSFSPRVLRFSDWIKENSSNRKILLYVAGSILVSGAMQFLEQKTPVPAGISIPLKLDFRPFSSMRDVEAVFGIYGEIGRNLYFWQNVLDMILPIPVCLMIGAVYSRASSFLNSPLRWNVLPFGFFALDLIENSVMIYLLQIWPRIPEGLVAWNGTLTFLKLNFVIFGYGLLFGSLFVSSIVFILRKIKN